MGKRFIFTGGGSGGHVSPALAVITELKREMPDSEILYVGMAGKAECAMVPKAGVPLRLVKSAPMPAGKSPVQLAKFAVTLTLGILKAIGILLSFRPDLVFATGGYVSAPTVFGAWILRKISFGLFKTKILLHESNVDLGKMNKMAAHAADFIAVSFPETIKSLKSEKSFYSGYPVRSTISRHDKSEARKTLGIPEKSFVIFAFGGSQGSRTINRVLAEAAPELLKDPDIFIINGAGKPFGSSGGYDGCKDVREILKKEGLAGNDRYLLKDFIDDMGLYYAASDLLVIRAGAGSIMEVCRQGKPSVIIPITNLANDHQVGNARFIGKLGAARVVYEEPEALSPTGIAFADKNEFIRTVSELKGDADALKEMSEKAKNIFPGNPAEIIISNIKYMIGEAPKPEPVGCALLFNDRLIGLNSVTLESFMRKVSNGTERPLDPDEERLIKSKIRLLFVSKNPIFNARACRVAGIAGFCDLMPSVLGFAKNLESKPFTSRDAFQALSMLMAGCEERFRDEIVDAVLLGIRNGYYETRFNAERCIPVFEKRFGFSGEEKGRLLEVLYKNFKDRAFEVRTEAVSAASFIDSDSSVIMKMLQRCYYDPCWKVRISVMKALRHLSENGTITAETALTELDKILITSTGYTTEYELKQVYKTVKTAISTESR